MSRKIVFDDQPGLPFEEWENPYSDSNTDAESPGQPPEPLYFCSFGSGSSGNSCYIGSAAGGIIVDVGVRVEEIEAGLASNGVNMRHVKAILLTHDHSDHVKYVYSMLRNNKHIKLFCSNRVLNGLLRKHSISRRIKEYHVPVFKEIPFKILDFEITAFDVPHDGTDNMGFSIDFRGRRFVVATDLGEVTDRAHYYMSRASYLMLEANYDYKMLRMGRYPEYLKARIMSGHGHLDNCQTAAILAEIVNPAMSHVFLCHLSQDNNTPQIALRVVRESLEARGLKVGNAADTFEDLKADVQLAVLPRFGMTRWFVFRD
ncbi:MAG: MBL fold metallo-hydrolase [Muribaculaceae bacterium]|nr:MBL fold metallo-hydrolase [Muribaculaceae bacterium]